MHVPAGLPVPGDAAVALQGLSPALPAHRAHPLIPLGRIQD